jgi:adenosine deaminase
VALSSNQCLRVTPDLGAHPLRAMIDAGVPVTLSTDDPPFFGTDLNREYERAHLELGFSPAALWQVNLNGLRHGLGDVALRRRLMRAFESEGRALGLA